MSESLDAIVVGGGPNGLAAAIRLAQLGWRVTLYEAQPTIGGAVRSEALTLPGFRHDVGSSIHPLAFASPFFSQLPLHQFGLEWIHPTIPVAHPLDDGTAAAQYRSINETAEALGSDGKAWTRLMSPFVKDWDKIAQQFLGPLQIPRHPFAVARFGIPAIMPTTLLTRLVFRTEKARALFAGLAAHSFLPLDAPASSAFGLVLGVLAHRGGWPFPRGGAQSLADALARYFESLGGNILLDHPIQSMRDLPPARAYLFDLTPRQVLAIAGDDLSTGYRRALKRYRYGPGVFKVDYAVSDPIPWTAPEPRHAGTVHLGGTIRELATSERAPHRGHHAENPYVLLAQHSLFDDSRAPDGQHTVWAYCHVPNGSTRDMSDIITAQIERFAPGFRETILASHTMNTVALQGWDANLIGGDISGGAADVLQLFTRPAIKWRPYRTSSRQIYLCSASTPPGGGVHGMAGFWGAETAHSDHYSAT